MGLVKFRSEMCSKGFFSFTTIKVDAQLNTRSCNAQQKEGTIKPEASINDKSSNFKLALTISLFVLIRYQPDKVLENYAYKLLQNSSGVLCVMIVLSSLHAVDCVILIALHAGVLTAIIPLYIYI